MLGWKKKVAAAEADIAAARADREGAERSLRVAEAQAQRVVGERQRIDTRARQNGFAFGLEIIVQPRES